MVTDTRRLADPLAAAEHMPRGGAIILRHYDWPERRVLAERLLAVCRRRGLLLLIAGDAKLALQIGADGVHLPEHALLGLATMGASPRSHKRRLLFTAAAHSQAALTRAFRLGVDAALLSPVFPSPSPPRRAPLGNLRFALMVRSALLPVYALGGIHAGNARRLLGSGAVGVAALEGLAFPTHSP